MRGSSGFGWKVAWKPAKLVKVNHELTHGIGRDTYTLLP